MHSVIPTETYNLVTVVGTTIPVSFPSCYSNANRFFICVVDFFMVIKSARFTGGDFMYLYRFMCHCARYPSHLTQILFTWKLPNNSSNFFRFWYGWWPWPIDYLIRFCSIWVVTLILNFEDQIWNLLYIDQNGLARKRKADISTEF